MKPRAVQAGRARAASSAAHSAAFLLAAALTLVWGCATGRGPSAAPEPAREAPAPAPAGDAIWQQYFAAVEAAKYPDRSKISKDLLPLLPDSEGLAWNDGRVLMVTWTKKRYYPDPPFSRGYEFPLHATTWLTAYPVVRELCGSYAGADLEMRLRQLIGLPPDDDKDSFVELWVRPQDLSRPCPDPGISDSQCQVSIPLTDPPRYRPADGEPPWYCAPPGAAPAQQQGQFVIVRQSHLDWMCRNWLDSYDNEDPKTNYPWTALGYTYDWGNPEDPRGPSEFVAVGEARVIFERLVDTASYCGR